MNLSFLKQRHDHSELSSVGASAAFVTDLHAVDAASAHGHYRRFCDHLANVYKHGGLSSLVPALPFLLSLKGKPYSLKDHFMMEPLFSLVMPRNTVIKSARQVSKSVSMAAQAVIQAAVIDYFSSLYVAPRFEQTRRFSNNYVRPFIQDSPVGHLLTSAKVEQSVLQRTFMNRSNMYFSFAYLDCDRIRGISADKVYFDEAQDLDPEFIPVIQEVMSHSKKFNITQYAGTPKTFDNLLQYCYDASSQAEWIIPCAACHHANICCADEDLLNIIQKPGPCCAKCGKPILPRSGHWEHRYRDKIPTFPGYHVPQVILPVHYEPDDNGSMAKWDELYAAKLKMDKATFYNEKLGESCDIRTALLSRSDLMAASGTWTNEIKAAVARVKSGRYIDVVMGVDWGGGGLKQVSYTTIAVVGFLPGHKSEVVYAERLNSAYDAAEEVAIILRYSLMFGVSILAHDFGGSGAVREILLLQSGFDYSRLFPCQYVGATSKNMVTYKPPTGDSTRAYYSIDKAKSIVFLCQLVAYGIIKFPKFETWEQLANDFMALVEDKREVARGSDIYLVGRKSTMSDDLVHGVNFAHLAHWHSTASYPDLSASIGLRQAAEAVKKYSADSALIDALNGGGQAFET